MCFQRPKRPENMPSSVLDIQLVDTSRELPSDFAIRVIEREINLERYWQGTTVQELVELYSLAIEHYSLKGDEKAKDYQVRMHKLLRRPEVVKILSPEKPKISNPIDSPNRSPQEISSAISSKNSEGENIDAQVTEIESQAKEAVKTVKIADKIIGDKLADSVKSQESDLVTRLKRRKVSRQFSNASFVISPVSEIESPISSYTHESHKELENAIQDIMERNYEEKSNKIAEITFKYSTEISEMEDSGMMGMVVTHMRENLKKEISEISLEYDGKRKAELKIFKESYLLNNSKN